MNTIAGTSFHAADITTNAITPTAIHMPAIAKSKLAGLPIQARARRLSLPFGAPPLARVVIYLAKEYSNCCVQAY